MRLSHFQDTRPPTPAVMLMRAPDLRPSHGTESSSQKALNSKADTEPDQNRFGFGPPPRTKPACDYAQYDAERTPPTAEQNQQSGAQYDAGQGGPPEGPAPRRPSFTACTKHGKETTP